MTDERDDSAQRVPQVVNRIMVALHCSERSEFAEMGLTIPAARALLFVRRHGPMRVSQLAEMLGMEDSAMSHLLQKLERRRLIARERFSEDRRAVFVSLTPPGRALASACDEISGRAASRLLHDFPQADVVRLRTLLEQVLGNVKISGGISGHLVQEHRV